MASALTPSFRPMTAADLDAATYIRKAALESLTPQTSVPRDPWQPLRYPHFEHLLATDPDGAWVASVGGTVVGFSMGFVRGHIWFLAQLFVMPEVHALGLGQELLRLAMDAGRARGATITSVVSSTSPVAQSLYMRAGMYPAGIGYRMSGPVAALTSLPAPTATPKRIADCDGWRERLVDLDTLAFGAPRPHEHELHARGVEGSAAASLAINRDGKLAGYVYPRTDGHVGPLAAYEPADQLQLLRVAGDWLAERDVADGWTWVIGENATVMGALLAGGWRLGGWTFFLTSQRYGSFDRYVPSGGLLL